jgi:hypothetical protein
MDVVSASGKDFDRLKMWEDHRFYKLFTLSWPTQCALLRALIDGALKVGFLSLQG